MTIFFIHITKTAGGSLKEALRASPADVLFHYNTDEGFRLAFDYEERPEIVYGHFLFGDHEKMGLIPRYACFLREPVARTISHYHHLKSNDFSRVGDRVRAYENLSDYLLQERRWEFDNLQCRILSGVGDKIAFGDVGFSVYEKARQNLERYFEFVGIFERMDESLDQLRQLVPSLNCDLPMVNKGSYDKETPAETERLVNSLNHFDRLLYDDALAFTRSRNRSFTARMQRSLNRA